MKNVEKLKYRADCSFISPMGTVCDKQAEFRLSMDYQKRIQEVVRTFYASGEVMAAIKKNALQTNYSDHLCKDHTEVVGAMYRYLKVIGE